MTAVAQVNESMSVYYPACKKRKNDNDLYDLYLSFTIRHNNYSSDGGYFITWINL